MMQDVDIVLLRPTTFPLVIVKFIIVVIKVVMMVELDICIKIPETLPLTIVEQWLILMGEVDIGLR